MEITMKRLLLFLLASCVPLLGQQAYPGTPAPGGMYVSTNGYIAGPWNPFMAAAGTQAYSGTPGAVGLYYSSTGNIAGPWYPCTLAVCFGSATGTVTTTGSPASGDIAAFSSATAITTATATQINTLIKTLTGCNTATFLYSPQAGDCVAPSGGTYTNVTGSASETTVALINTACGSGTYYATTPLTITTGGTITCPVQFSKGGVWGGSGSPTVTLAKPFTETDGPNQHFLNTLTIVLAPQVAHIEAFGAVVYPSLSLAVSGTDSTAASNACLSSIGEGGSCDEQIGFYRLTAPLVDNRSGVNMHGVISSAVAGASYGGNSVLSAFVQTTLDKDSLDLGGTSGAYTVGNQIVNLGFFYSGVPTGTATGVSMVFCSQCILSGVAVNDSVLGQHFHGTPNSFAINSWVNLGYNGFPETSGSFNLYDVDTSGGVPLDSLTLINPQASTNGLSAITTKAISLTGTLISDFRASNCDFGRTSYGAYINYTGTTSGPRASDIAFTGCKMDGQYISPYYINSISEASAQAALMGIDVDGGEMSMSPTTGCSVPMVDVNNAYMVNFRGVEAFNTCTATVYSVTGSRSVGITDTRTTLENNSTTNCGVLTNSAYGTYNGNKCFQNNAGKTETMLSLINASNWGLEGNDYAGAASIGISLDAASVNNETVNVGNYFGDATTPISDAGTGNQFTGALTSVSNSDGTLTISPATGAVVASLALGHANTWTGQQTFVAPVLGTPASGVLTNTTGLPAASVVAGALANGMLATTQAGGDSTTKLATTAFVAAAIAAAGTGAGIVTYSGPSLTFSGTQFFPIGGGGLASTTETNVDIDSPAAVTIQNMTVQMSAAPGVGNSVVYTWRKNASSQTLTCTISGASATSCSDTTHNFTTASLDLLDIQAVTTGTIVGTPTVVMAAQVGVAAPATGVTSVFGQTGAVPDLSGDASTSGSSVVSVTKVNGVTISGTPATGKVPTATGSTTATWQTPASAGNWINITNLVTPTGCTVSGSAPFVCTINASTSVVSFASIPGTYLNLKFYFSGFSSTGSVGAFNTTFNGDTGAHYDEYSPQVNGSAALAVASAFAGTSFESLLMSGTSGHAGGGYIEVPGYTQAFNKFASGVTGALGANNAGSFSFTTNAGWNSTAAITSATFTTISGNASGYFIVYASN